MNIIWIASYPKSGNTWLRFMLYSALFGSPKNSIDISKKIPDLHRRMPFDEPDSGPMYMKTHLELTEKHPMMQHSLKAIHIMRNPRDVLLSSLNYRKLSSERAESLSTTEYANAFIKYGGDPGWMKMGFGTWASHTRSWMNNDRFPVLTLRYESLKENPHAGLESILSFLEIKRTPEQVDEAIQASSFDVMRAMEIREKNASKSDDLTKRLFVGSQKAARSGMYFMNAGKTNQSLDQVVQGLDERFDAKFESALTEFGY